MQRTAFPWHHDAEGRIRNVADKRRTSVKGGSGCLAVTRDVKSARATANVPNVSAAALMSTSMKVNLNADTALEEEFALRVTARAAGVSLVRRSRENPTDPLPKLEEPCRQQSVSRLE